MTSIKLKNGIVVDFVDRSNRYYGDFHRVKIDVVAKFPVDKSHLPEELHEIADCCGGEATFQRSLEQMGVKTAEVEAVAQALVANFIDTAGSYFEKRNFVESLLRKQLRSG